MSADVIAKVREEFARTISRFETCATAHGSDREYIEAATESARAALALLDRVERVEVWVERGKPGVPIADVIRHDFEHDGHSFVYPERDTESVPALLLLAPTEGDDG